MLEENKYENDSDDSFDMTFDRRGDHKMELNEVAEKNAEYFSENSNIKVLINGHLDKANRAEKQLCNVSIDS